MENKYRQELIVIGQRIRDLRISMKLTQMSLSAICEVDVRTIQRLEKGNMNPSFKTLYVVSKALNVDVSFITRIESSID